MDVNFIHNYQAFLFKYIINFNITEQTSMQDTGWLIFIPQMNVTNRRIDMISFIAQA
jgi:hypothetical protein